MWTVILIANGADSFSIVLYLQFYVKAAWLDNCFFAGYGLAWNTTSWSVSTLHLWVRLVSTKDLYDKLTVLHEQDLNHGSHDCVPSPPTPLSLELALNDNDALLLWINTIQTYLALPAHENIFYCALCQCLYVLISRRNHLVLSLILTFLG